MVLCLHFSKFADKRTRRLGGPFFGNLFIFCKKRKKDRNCNGGFRYYDINLTVEDDADGGTQETIMDPQGQDNLPVGDGFGVGSNPCGPSGTVCDTALGPIGTNVGEFAGQILDIGIGLAGGIALILMVIGSVRVLTSSGNQQRLAGGRDMIVAAIAGLLFLIFSILILKFIGVEILEIPGFG